MSENERVINIINDKVEGVGEEEEREEKTGGKDRYYLRGFACVDIAQCQALALNIVGWDTTM